MFGGSIIGGAEQGFYYMERIFDIIRNIIAALFGGGLFGSNTTTAAPAETETTTEPVA